MNVVFVSNCQDRAAKRTQRILDSYAIRIAPRTWASPVTEQGLRDIRQALAIGASRRSAIACYKARGARDMRLLWVVGSHKRFGAEGQFAIGIRTSRRPTPTWIRLGALFVHIAGLAHDWGKGTQLFQDKLKSTIPVKDAVRHEWMSAWLLNPFLFDVHKPPQEEAWESSARCAANANRLARPLDNEDGIKTIEDVISFLVVSHHRLSGEPYSLGACGPEGHVDRERADHKKLEPCKEAFSALRPSMGKAQRLYARLKSKADGGVWSQSADVLTGLAWLGRAALILADHSVSGVTNRKLFGTVEYKHPLANTILNPGKKRIPNQPLAWHLQEVGAAAGRMLWNMQSWRPEGLSEGTLDIIRKRSKDRFDWQNRAEDFVIKVANTTEGPILVLNTAGTGCGKTRTNARMAAGLSSARGRPTRFCAALNLRSLTLQTSRAWQKQWGVDDTEIACVIGDRWTQKLFDSEHEADPDGNPIEVEYESFDVEASIPAWLEEFAIRKPILKKILLPPVLVSTIDFLIDAANPGRQGNHALAMLRLKGSTLILDEVDSYDTHAMVAVLRLARIAAMLGADVIASSATLPAPVASALMQAFFSGARIHHALQNVDTPDKMFDAHTVMVNENEVCSVNGIPGLNMSQEDAKTTYRDFMLRDAQNMKKLRVPRIVQINEDASAKDRFNNAVRRECEAMNKHHGWACGTQGKRVSFGLVRVANISTAIHVAQALAEVNHFRVCCYHSQEMRLIRHMKEAALDRLLSRQPSRENPTGSAHIADDREISGILERFSGDALAFIVVATPVEEIGRDHDFDWAVIEPSGARSVVQCAGRVNRHRLTAVETPNVAILQYNIRYLKNPHDPSFCRPGLETSQQKYKSHDLHELINPDLFSVVDSRLVFDDRHIIVGEETRILEDLLREPLQTVMGRRPNWMARGHYDIYALRKSEDMPSLNLFYKPEVNTFYETPYENEIYVHPASKSDNDWLSFDKEASENFRQSIGMSCKDAYSVQIHSYGNQRLCWYHSWGFQAE